MSDTPRIDSWWNSYRTGAITAKAFKEAVQGMERDLAAARAKAEQLEAEKESAYDKGFEAGIKEDRSDPGITDFERI